MVIAVFRQRAHFPPKSLKSPLRDAPGKDLEIISGSLLDHFGRPLAHLGASSFQGAL